MSNMVFPTCPREDCTFIGHHWHEEDGSIGSHSGSTCNDPWSPGSPFGCVSARVSAAPTDPEPEPESSARLVIPEITDEEVEACFEDAWGPRCVPMRGECRSLLEAYRARLIESLDAWKPVPAGATIPVGVRHRCEYAESGDAREVTRRATLLVRDDPACFVRASDWGQVILPEPEPDPPEVMDEAVARELYADAASRAFEMVLGTGKGFDGLEAEGRDYWLSEARRLREVQDRAGYTVEPKPREGGAS